MNQRNKFKLSILILQLLVGTCLFSCSNDPNEELYGDWEISEIKHQGHDFFKQISPVVFSDRLHLELSNNKQLIIHDKYDDSSETVIARYNFYREKKEILMNISEATNRSLNGNYNIYLDTIAGPLYLTIELIADSEETYFIAYKMVKQF